MSTLSKKTKGQLLEIAEELNIDVSDCKVKKDVYEVVKEYFIKNANDFDENSKFYELASISKLGSGKKSTIYIEGENGDVKQIDVIEDEDIETEEAEDENDDEENGNGEEEDIDDDEDDEYNEDEGDDNEDDDDIDFECYTNLVKAVQHGTLREYMELKNYEIRDYLGDPYTLNEITFGLESAFLLYSLSSFTSLDTYFSSSVSQYLPNSLLKLPTLTTETFSFQNGVTVLLWYLAAKVFPVFFSYYVNFTYDFDRDAFTEALAKLFVSILIFKTDIGFNSITDELKYTFSFGNVTLATFKHFLFVSTLTLRDVFGNWILLNALFTSILALYANLAFV
ncbi:hypothetical protein CANINC_003415 [Pichia inconspicua]|uniref:Rho termination factor N-terminal domain-containing protein n=1 Tax=Pichia inconspicua TaxID=52247 RepID=A0A4T0X023_9ASCO|nr:hypothetical protein CANINC_003415 [[Candida] inconspicua]